MIGASMVALATGIASADTTVAPGHASRPIVPSVHILTYKVAPADEYFGKMKMSILGIGNVIKDDGLKIDADATQADHLGNSIALVEDAVHDWEHKYPQDTWIPRVLFRLERLYAKIDSDAARTKAKLTMTWLVRDFPRSPQAKIGTAELAANKVGVKPALATAVSDPQPAASPAQTSTGQ
jgi:hypothetical protein